MYQDEPNNLGETLIVASELKQITSVARNNINNPVYNDSNLIKPKHFPPGHFMTFNMDNGTHNIQRYWSPYEHVYYSIK